MRARRVGRAAIPDATEFSRRHLDERGIGVLDPGVVEGFLCAPITTGHFGLIAQRRPSAIRKTRPAQVALGRTVAVDVDVGAIRGAAEEALGFGIVQIRLLPGNAPSVPPIPTDTLISARRVGRFIGIIVIGRAHDDFQFPRMITRGDVTLV